jgi:hypothetical protein
MKNRKREPNRAAQQRHRPEPEPEGAHAGRCVDGLSYADTEPAPQVTESRARNTRGNNRWDAIRSLEQTVALERDVARRRSRQVRAARAAGASWTELARVLGVSPQAVQQRYGKQP